MTFEGKGNRKNLLISMGVVAAVVIGVGLGTLTITSYFRSKDPIYQCIGERKAQDDSIMIEFTRRN